MKYLIFSSVLKLIQSGANDVAWSIESLPCSHTALVRLPVRSEILISFLALDMSSLSVFCTVLSLAVVLTFY